MSYLDSNGLSYFWSKLKVLFSQKADIDHTHTDLETRIAELEKQLANKQDIIYSWSELNNTKS